MGAKHPRGPALPEFVLVTGNPNKALEVERLLGYRPEIAAIDLPEIQSLDLQLVVEEKVREAWRHLQRPLIVEDIALGLRALNGFPGPLIKWMLQAVGPSGLWRTADALGDLGVQATCLLAYFDGQQISMAEGRVDGSLVPPRGTGGFGWDSVFLPQGSELTYAEMSQENKDRVGHRGLAWRAFAALPPKP